jgi:predicted dinucleotide-binding enzyme
VTRLIDRLGFDPVDAGSLEDGAALEPEGSRAQVGFTPTR